MFGMRRLGLQVGFTFLILASLPPLSLAKDHLTIDSQPPGATVEIDGIVVGKTPYSMEVPGGYIHETRSVFGQVLRQQMHVRLRLDGYLPLDSDLARGPMPWIALNGVYHGDYWLLKTANFSFTLNKAATAFTGNVQVASANEGLSLRSSLSPEEIVRMASPAVLFLRGTDGTGSGFLVTATGVAVTNAHVAKGQSVLAASTANGQTFNADVQYIDPDLDLALLKLEGTRLYIGDSRTRAERGPPCYPFGIHSCRPRAGLCSKSKHSTGTTTNETNWSGNLGCLGFGTSSAHSY